MKSQNPQIVFAAIGVVFGVLFLAGSAQAASGVSVTYPGSEVGDPIFDEQNWAPGASVTKTVTLTNHDPQSRDAHLVVTEKPNGKLAQKLTFEISGTYGPATLKNTYGDSPIPLGAISAGETRTYDFTIELGSDADDEYQNQKTVFDLTFYFEGEEGEVAGAGTDFPGPRGDGTMDLPTPAEFLPQVFSAATTPLQKALPAVLPKVGDWSIFSALALAGLGIIFLIWRKK